MRKDIKKSSYYVWFLGAQEAKGLRGLEYIAPVVRDLVDREREVEPFKVTLQVSHKGLKIVQNVPAAGVAIARGKPAPKASGKPEVVKHFIPHHAVTCVHQQEDLVACILLLFNPVTECPVHVHAYRCDSVETATVLHRQLRVLIDRPDNQKKLGEIEARLTAKGLLGPQTRKRVPVTGSDGRSTRESESSGGSSSERLSGVGNPERLANLYDSLAAELREKLGTKGSQAHAPILLPPRDYDTVHRQKGNLSHINARRCLNSNIVGVNVTATGGPGVAAVGSSGGSSGIGSDHAPSPDHDPAPLPDPDRFLDNQSTSDEEWNAEANKDSLFLVQGGGEMSLPRARRLNSSNSGRGQNHTGEQVIHPDLVKLKKHYGAEFNSQTDSHPSSGQRRRRNAEERQRSPSPTDAGSTIGSPTPRDRFNDAKEKFLSLEREKQEERERQEKAIMNERRRNTQSIEPPILPAMMPVERSRPTRSWSRSKDSEDELEDLSQRGYSNNIDNYKYHNNRDFVPALRREPSYIRSQSHGSIPDSEEYPQRQQGKHRGAPFAHREDRHLSPPRGNLDNHGYNMPEEINKPSHMNRRYTSPRREPSPEIKQRKERCTSPVMNSSRPPPRKFTEDSPVEDRNSRFVGKIPRGHLSINQVPLAESNNSIPLERYRSPTRVNPPPRPSMRHQRYPTTTSEEEEDRRDYRHMMHPEAMNFPPRAMQYDKKRRSMYESIEDERRRNSNELAKEFKRRSYQDHGPNIESNSLGYQELDERERYPGLDRETARPHQPEEVPTLSPRYRHSYAEPFHQYQQPMQPHHEMLHRTNSSLSSGRVGMAAIHPY
ncbi:uncharacterized protein LOC128998552 [Macrosteles quadrilineatus]|uniref:uncharacterized protein LOC128998552 n=1 Tax=Macrosteles quadrilineatus TaxID=74068 RepID=UPI0023E20240|nr:uncharacterized protein LOC128998552 [Macrosteles quadrilineatus]